MHDEEELRDLRKELEEVRQLKENLKAEIADLHRDSPPPRLPRPKRTVQIEAPVIDLSGLTESLETLMEDIGEQIEDSLGNLHEAKERIKEKRILRARGRDRPRTRDSEVEAIPPERVASFIGPLGSEERLRILDYLKSGGKTFNELEQHTGRTGSSLTHHLNPLVNAGYVIKGEVRGTYYVTVEGRLAYRLSQWLTSRLESEIEGRRYRDDDDYDEDDDDEDEDDEYEDDDDYDLEDW
ncbi:ArsR family transcriptional regulator [Candidatus Bathyarchaeota archaeon]|nr:ArsR family transcriptional regulator [Candidatus Bathyarchaeota archaeon]